MLLNQKDFAAALKIKYSTLRSHIHRKKILTVGEYIDTDSELTKNYIKHQTKGLGLDLTGYLRSESSQLEKKYLLEKEEISNKLIDEVNIKIDIAVKAIKEETAKEIKKIVNDFLPAKNKAFQK